MRKNLKLLHKVHLRRDQGNPEGHSVILIVTTITISKKSQWTISINVITLCNK